MGVQEFVDQFHVTRRICGHFWRVDLMLSTTGHVHVAGGTAGDLLDGWKVDVPVFPSGDEANDFICILEDTAQAAVLTPSLTIVRTVENTA